MNPCKSCQGSGNDERDEGWDSKKYACQECIGTGAAPVNDRGQGRKPNPPEQQTKPRSVRLNDARWLKLKALGSEWLAKQIDKAKVLP